ncbi:hypothetical protein PQQ73_06270 [Paraburkholderia strydomiana]|uniref:Uncharacterized protein n=1 Tax=Paraburkholderia strydomiana TaxID=1245417 RepID=A0ABW9E8K8_9BURK
MADKQHNAGSLARESGGEERVEFFCDLGGPVIDAEAFLTAFVVNFYKPEPGKPNEPARILAAEEFWQRAHSLLEGASFDRDVAATQALEELRCAVEEAVRAGRLIPRYDDTLAMRAGMRGRRKYAKIHRVFFERSAFIAFVRDQAPTIDGGPVDAAVPSAPDAVPVPEVVPASIGIPPALTPRKGGKLAAKWLGAEHAALLAWRDLLAAQGDNDAIGKIAAALQVSRETVRKHLEKALATAKAAPCRTHVKDGKRRDG